MCDQCDDAEGIINEFEAREIASEWHGGQFTDLYAFSSSGHLAPTTLEHEVQREIDRFNPSNHQDEDSKGPEEELARLHDLLIYVQRHAPEDTSEDPCTEHDFEVCPDCGNAGTKIGDAGYESCTRFLSCWSDSDVARGVIS